MTAPNSRPVGGAPSVRARLAGLAATLGLVAIVAGLPVGLLAIGANPLPDQVPSWDQVQTALTRPDDGTLFLRAIALIAWLAWAFMAISVLVEVLSQLRGVRAPRLPGLQLPQSAARSLVGTAALLFIAAPAILQPGQPSTIAATPTHATSATQAPTQAPTEHLAPGTPEGNADRGADRGAEQDHQLEKERPKTKPHLVVPGDTLWSLAGTHLGDGARYPELVELNRDMVGDDPGFLDPGWVLQIPDTDDYHDEPGATGAADVDLKPGERVVTVKLDDTLSEIAATEIADPNAYPRIFEASQDITQPGGAQLTDPDMIDVGWTLVIPADSSADSSEAGSDDRRPDDRHGDRGPGSNQRPDETPPATEADPPLEEPVEPPTQPQETAPADTEDQVDQADDGAEDGAEDRGGLDAPWLLIGLTGGGAVLAAGLYRGLNTRRRAQWRARRPGRAVAAPGPELAPVEKTINTAGAAAAATIEFMDEALRRLAGRRAGDHQPMPAMAAVELNEHNLVLHLTGPIDLDTPWEGTADGLHWRCGTDVDLDDLGPAFEELVDQPAPYPMLVTVGSSDAGDVWLLNCEELAAVTITGDATYGRDFARYLAAELTVNPWSDGIVVDCIGIAEEIAPMERDRIRCHRPGTAGDQATGEALADAVATVARSQKAGVDVVTGRAAQVGDDVWPARLLLVDATGHTKAEDGAAEPQMLSELLRLTVDHTGHTGTAVVIAGATGEGRAETPGTVLHMTSNGRVQLADAGLDLVAVGLTSDEAHGCAALLAQAEDRTDTDMPVDETAEEGLEAYTTRSGSLRTEYTRPRGSGSGTRSATDSYLDNSGSISGDERVEGVEAADPAESVLPAPDEDYIAAAATTAEDLAALAPEVPVSVRAEVEAATRTLDEDVAAWFDPNSNRPKLTLLGPVSARTHGKALTGRKAFYTELLTYLALRRGTGATPAEVAEAFHLKPGRVRVDVNVVRDWLGVNPATGAKHLPDAPDAPATQRHGVNVYQIDDGLLVDAHLFSHLFARGQSRGPAGIQDLRLALRMVTGRPFAQLRPTGGRWLDEGQRTDLEMQAAVADVAHIVATHGLTVGDLDLARFAVEKAMDAAPDEDTTQMNRAALAAAEGFPEEAERILRDEVCNRSDGHAPLDLTERTEEILRNHERLATG